MEVAEFARGTPLSMSLSSILWTHPISRIRPDRKTRRRVCRHILQQVKPCWPQLPGIMSLSLLSPLPLKIAVDSVLGTKPVPAWLTWAAPGGSPMSTLLLAAGLLLAVAILMHLQALASWILQTYTGEKLVLDLRARMFWHAQRLSLSFHTRRGSSDTAYRIQHDAPSIQYVTIQGAVPFLNAI